MKEKQRDNPKLAFLFDSSLPAHAYYQYRIAQLQRPAGCGRRRIGRRRRLLRHRHRHT